MITPLLILSLIGLALLGVILAWSTRRAWRLSNGFVKWPTTLLTGLLTVVVLGVIGLALAGLYRIYRPVTPEAPATTVAATAEALARGERLAYLCAACHSPDGTLPLTGAANDISEGALGALYPPNLTPGGALASWSDGAVIRAIRQGVHANGRSLLLMPSEQYRAMNDADVGALVAYLRSQPAVAKELPATQVNLLGAAVIGAGLFPLSRQSLDTDEPTALTPGDYLVTIGGCAACHGAGLRGGTDPYVPMGPNLPGLVTHWTAAEFVATIRTGTNPYGRVLDREQMPWHLYHQAFTDAELTAIYEYIVTLPPVVAE